MRRFSRSTRHGLLGSLVVATVLLTGCTAPDPEITFYADRAAARVGPAQYCDAEITSCAAHPQAVAVLRVPPGRPVQISVPGEVAAAPWQVAFRYRDQAGQEQEERSKVFSPAERQLSYVLRLPNPADQLETAEIQEFGVGLLSPQAGDPAGSGFQFVIRGTWVLSVDDRARP